MKKLKKILAVVISMAMVLGMSLTAFAEEAAGSAKPVATDVATAQVTNVEATATVTAYQIVKANYNDAGFTGYSLVDGVLIADLTNPTSDEITTIANNTTFLAGAEKVTMNAGTADADGLATFTGDLKPGSWMVLVSGTVKEVYNPMLVSVYYSVSGSDNTMNPGTVDANSNWKLETTDAYAKSTKPSVDKAIVDDKGNEISDKDVAIGDTVYFKITTKIPSYSKDYSAVIVKISDVLSKGLTLNEDSIKVTDGVEYEVNSKTAAGFELQIDSDYALANGN